MDSKLFFDFFQTGNRSLDSWKKALQALETYGVDMVIANELKTRRNKVTIYEKKKKVGT